MSDEIVSREEIYVHRRELEAIGDFLRERSTQGLGLSFEIRKVSTDGDKDRKELRIQPASGGITLVVEQEVE